MKKLIVALALASLTLTACVGPHGPKTQIGAATGAASGGLIAAAAAVHADAHGHEREEQGDDEHPAIAHALLELVEDEGSTDTQHHALPSSRVS